MAGIISKLSGLLHPRKSSDGARFQFYDTGFHGDAYLLKLVDTLMSSCNVFIETGTNVGSTLAYVANRFPGIRCFSCEPDKEAYDFARKNTASCVNANLYNDSSESFLERLINEHGILNDDALLWIDAHGYGFKWPLREEMKIITSQFDSAFMLIDDFRVPGLDCFGYDQYEEQECSFDYIENSLSNRHEYRLYYPSYTERTSTHHPLRGWCLLEFGHEAEIEIPESLNGKIRKTIVNV